MNKANVDATEVIRLAASSYPDVDEGTACTQSSFKTGKKAFLFIGQQGGRHKAMFRLKSSIAQASALADKRPEDFQVGNVSGSGVSWVTARFTDESSLPRSLWKKWLDESYTLTTPSVAGKTAKAGSQASSQARSKARSKATSKAIRKKK